MEIKTTQDYSLFKNVAGNRQVNKHHVESLMKDIAENGLIYEIIVNDDMEIIDGQHRLEALKKLGLPVSYRSLQGLDLNAVHKINFLQKRWRLEEYVSSYISLGIEDYKFLKEFTERNSLVYGISAFLLYAGDGNFGRGMSYSKIIKEGAFVANNKEQAQLFIEKAQILFPYVKITVWRDMDFWSAIKKLVKKETIDWGRLERKLETQNPQINPEVSFKDYLNIIEKVYNYHSPVRAQIY